MKRGAANSVENSKFAFKYSALLEDYLELQKDYVSKKRKLRAEKQKRDILLDEIRFLRQRHTYLAESHSAKTEPELGPCHNVNIPAGPIWKERNAVNETNIEQNVNGEQDLVRKVPKPIVAKQPKKISLNKKKNGKEKISWPDKFALRA